MGKPPELLSGSRIVRPDPVRAVGDELASALAPIDRGGAPCRFLLASRAPDLFPALEIVSGDEGVLLPVVLYDDEVIVDHGRARGSPLKFGLAPVADVEEPEVHPPSKLAVHVEAEESLRPEKSHQAPAVGRGGRGSVARLDVALQPRSSAVGGLPPEDFAGRLLEREDLPSMRHHVPSGVDARDVAVSKDERGIATGVSDGGRQVDAVAPDDGARVRETFHGSSPEDVRPRSKVPLYGQVLSIRDSASVRTAKLGPVDLGQNDEKKRGELQGRHLLARD
jgi:hypothetical protein